LTTEAALPLVTVVTPSYNQGRFIEATILSVLNQNYPYVEYLVVDGGSTDSTLDILRKYEERLIWISEPDSGQSHAINKGFKAARGEILCWLNSDDTFEPGAIRHAVEALQEDKRVKMLYGHGNLIDEDGRLISLFPYTRPFDLWALVYQLDFILQPTVFMRKDILEDVDYLDETLKWCMDWDLWIRIGSRSCVKFTDRVLANARIYGDTKTSTGGFPRLLEIISVLKRYRKGLFLPAYFFYGSSTLASFMYAALPCLYRQLRTITFPIRALLWIFAKNSQGVYQDGWIGKKAKFMFASGLSVDSVVFSLDIPDDARILPNEVFVDVNNTVVRKDALLTAGSFKVSVPYDNSLKLPLEITLKFKRTLPVDKSFRQLVCRLAGVELLTLNKGC